MASDRKLTILQILPALNTGGVERGTLEIGKYLVENGHRSLVMSSGGRMVEQLLAEGSEHFTWPVGKKSLWTLRLIWQLRRFLQAQKVDVLHVRSRMPAWVAYLAWKGMNPTSRPRFVTTVHGPYTVNGYSAVMTKGERVIAISEFIRRYILQNYPDVAANNIRLIQRGVDATQFPYSYQPSNAWLTTWQQQYPQLAGQKILTLPARLTRWKGQEDFVRLVAKLKQRGMAVHGLLVGEAHPRKQDFLQELRQLAATLGVESNITFVGHRNDMREIMAISDIVYSLSLEPEAFGRTTLEALSLGRPVIAYDHGGAGEQLAAIFPQGGVPVAGLDALETTTCTFLQHAPLVPSQHDFSLQAMKQKTLAVYTELSNLHKAASN
ncbi:MAG TPA: glycosyltransferase family 4 protein [Methylophilaceae bacterium]